MENQKPTTPDSFADLFFPGRGVHDGISLSDMPPGFTPTGVNVRVYEALTGRGRGGSRAGIDKFIPEQHSGDNEIQHLTSIVTVDGSLLGWAFEGRDMGFPGTYGGIGFLDQIPAGELIGFAGDGGGGYQPSPNVTSRQITMGARNPVTGRITMSFGTRRTVQWPAGPDPIQIRITNQDENQDFIGFENVTGVTDPSGAPGDGQTGPTQFDLTDPPAGLHGLFEFAVASPVPRTVDYYGYTVAVAGKKFTSRVPIRIRFTPFRLRLVRSAPTAPANGTTRTVTGTLTNHLGSVVPGKTIRLVTTPSGAVGDQTTAVSNGAGEVVFTVSSNEVQIVSYDGEELSETVEAEQEVEIYYFDDEEPEPDPENPPVFRVHTFYWEAVARKSAVLGGGVSAQSGNFTVTFIELHGTTGTGGTGSASGGFGIDGGSWTVTVDEAGVTISATFGSSPEPLPGGGPYVGVNANPMFIPHLWIEDEFGYFRSSFDGFGGSVDAVGDTFGLSVQSISVSIE